MRYATPRWVQEAGAKGEAPVTKSVGRFVVAMGHDDPRGRFLPVTKPGIHNVYISVGRLDGEPVIALPHDGDEGRRRYLLGRIELMERLAP